MCKSVFSITISDCFQTYMVFWFVLPKIQVLIQENYLKIISLLPSSFQVNLLFSLSHALLSLPLFFSPIPLPFIHGLLLFLAPWQPTQHFWFLQYCSFFLLLYLWRHHRLKHTLEVFVLPRIFGVQILYSLGFLTSAVYSVTWSALCSSKGLNVNIICKIW